MTYNIIIYYFFRVIFYKLILKKKIHLNGKAYFILVEKSSFLGQTSLRTFQRFPKI